MKIDGIHYMMPTVFKDSDSIDIESMINIANYAKKSGCVGLVLLGVMGEAHRLDESEKILLLEEISNVSREVKLLLTVGVSAESGYLASSFAAKASEFGANQVMLAPPIMKKPNEQILYRYYKDVNDAISKNTSLVVQDLPDQSGVYMSPEFMTHLDNNLEKINSIKLEDPPTPKKITKIMNLKSDNLKIFGGLGGLFFFEELLRGASWTMTGFSFTEILVQIYNYFVDNKYKEAKSLFYKWLPLIRYENSVGISLAIRKEILKQRKIIKYSNVRYPTPSIDLEDINELEQILKDYI